ncbi:MAG: glycosyltransferase [Burkholderiales bacterium]|nr:glycosyltransferase [Phycisphaerae bacterium]
MRALPKVSFVISTRNRREVLLRTLAHVDRCGLDAGEFDIHVVDNASSDGTSAAICEQFPAVRLITLTRNLGSVGKNEALPHALGQYVVFLDDDSYPTPGSIGRMIRHFEADPKLGALTFTITLPDGKRECSAYPDVFIGCGVGLRRRALRLVGGLPADFFMQAEEYDLSLRLLNAGFTVRTADDIHVTHLKTPQARVSARTMRLDVRNNLYLILRRFPAEWVAPYTLDWMRRYWWIAKSRNASGAFLYGIFDGLLRSMIRPRRDAVSAEAFEVFAKIAQTKSRLETCKARQGIRTVLLADVGKNIHAYWRACRDLDIRVVAIADRNLAHPARRYRGIPIVTDEKGRSLRYDAVIIANLSPVHAAMRRDQWRLTQDRPVIDLFESGFAEQLSSRGERPAESGSHQTAARSA